MILLVSFTSASGPLDAVKWAFISMALSVLPVFVVIIYLVRSGQVDAIFTNQRQHRTKTYVMASFCSIVGCIILAYLGAPSILVAGFTAALAMVVIFMFINLWWKISLHTGIIAASVTVLIMVYGGIATMTVALVPLSVWSRVELKHHSMAQATIGALLAALIVGMVFSVTHV